MFYNLKSHYFFVLIFFFFNFYHFQKFFTSSKNSSEYQHILSKNFTEYNLNSIKNFNITSIFIVNKVPFWFNHILYYIITSFLLFINYFSLLFSISNLIISKNKSNTYRIYMNHFYLYYNIINIYLLLIFIVKYKKIF